jgi:hypothetical protein
MHNNIADNELKQIMNDLNDQGYRRGEDEPSDDTSTLDLKYSKDDPRRYKGDLLF